MKYNSRATFILVICGLFLFYKYISQLFPSLISDVLIEQFKFTGVQIGILASSYYYSYSLMQVVAGIMLDRFSINLMAFFAIITISLAIIGFTYTNNFYLMCICRALMGFGCSFATALYLKCAAGFTSEKTFGLVSSLLATATMLGAAAGSAPVAVFFQKFSWHHGLFLIGLSGLILAVLSVISLRMKNDHNKNQIVTRARIKKVIINPINIQLLFYSGVTFSPIIIMGGLWGTPFLALKYNITTSSAAVFISMMFIGHAVGSPIWALLNYYLNNRKKLMLIANIIAFVAISLIIYLPATNQPSILFFSFGFAVGCFMLSFEMCREINGFLVMGIAAAFINLGEGLISIILEPGIGYLLDMLKLSDSANFSLSNYQIALSILPICYIISSLLVYRLPENISKVNRLQPNMDADAIQLNTI